MKAITLFTLYSRDVNEKFIFSRVIDTLNQLEIENPNYGFLKNIQRPLRAVVYEEEGTKQVRDWFRKVKEVKIKQYVYSLEFSKDLDATELTFYKGIIVGLHIKW